MLPVLFNLGALKIYTFGLFLILAFFWGSFLLWRNIRLTSFKEEDVFDGLFIALFGGLFIGRFFYVVLNFKDFGFSLLKFILINGYPGISLYGLLIGSFFSLYFFFTLKKIKAIEVFDYFITPIFTALFFGKVGSFFSGVEVGQKTKFFLKVRYLGFDGVRHLTPFYEAVFFGLGAYLSYKLLFQVRREKYSMGFIFYFFIWYFSLVYFIFDKIKIVNLYLLGYSFNKVVSVTLLLTTSVYFIYYFRSSIKNFIKTNGQKTWSKFNFQFKRKTSQGESKKSGAN